MKKVIELIQPNSFESENHWYPKALNATIHPMVAFFLNLEKERIVERYCHLNPLVTTNYLLDILSYKPKYFRWGGADLINVVTEKGTRKMVVIENNSCPSGQKSMPLLDETLELGGYQRLIEKTFAPSMKGQRFVADGVLAVLYDKNPMENSGYASAVADVFNEPVYYIYFPKDNYASYLRWEDGVLQFKNNQDQWVNIRAAFRYVTQKPWNRIPLHSKTKLLNPIISCISGGRNISDYDTYINKVVGN